MAIDDINPYRRNLILICIAFMVYHLGEGQPIEDIRFGLIGIKLNVPSTLTYLSYLLLFWIGIRYNQNTTFSNDPHVSKEQVYRTSIQNAITRSKIAKFIFRYKSQNHVDKFKADNKEYKDANLVISIKSVNYAPFIKFIIDIDIHDLKNTTMKCTNSNAVSDHRITLNWLNSLLIFLIAFPRSLAEDGNLLPHVTAYVLYGVTLGTYLIIRPIQLYFETGSFFL